MKRTWRTIKIWDWNVCVRVFVYYEYYEFARAQIPHIAIFRECDCYLYTHVAKNLFFCRINPALIWTHFVRIPLFSVCSFSFKSNYVHNAWIHFHCASFLIVIGSLRIHFGLRLWVCNCCKSIYLAREFMQKSRGQLIYYNVKRNPLYIFFMFIDDTK